MYNAETYLGKVAYDMYLDPGFGQMIIQVVVAAIAVGGAYFVLFKSKLRSFFKKDKASDGSLQASEAEAAAKLQTLKQQARKDKDAQS